MVNGDNWAKIRYLDASALVKLVCDEGDHTPVREFFSSQPNFATTSLCLAEALGVLKGKWEHGRLTDDQYFDATRFLVINAWGGKPKIDDIGLFNPAGAHAVQALAKRHSLDLSDALQLETILRGTYSHAGPNSASVLITGDKRLQAAAKSEGIRVWNCTTEPLPHWA